MIYQKTARGHKVLQDRSIPLAPKHRMIFILFDGKTTTADILKSAVGLGVDRADVLDLIEYANGSINTVWCKKSSR